MIEVLYISKFVENPDNLIHLYSLPGSNPELFEKNSVPNYINLMYAVNQFDIKEDVSWKEFIEDVVETDRTMRESRLYFKKYIPDMERAKEIATKAMETPYSDRVASLKAILNDIKPTEPREINRMIGILSDLNYDVSKFKMNPTSKRFDISPLTIKAMGSYYANQLHTVLMNLFPKALEGKTEYDVIKHIEDTSLTYTTI